MATCFVIQPFDHGVYDRRYLDTFEPAIRAAGLDPDRVDRDPGVSIPIQDIEQKIEGAAVCFAEISEDNPNVWFELGFAIARRKELCLVCSNIRTRYPFDVQHRSIIKYDTSSASDFEKLKNDIISRLAAVLKTATTVEQFQSNSPLEPTAEGLQQHELAAMAIIAASYPGHLTPYMLCQQMDRAGFTRTATRLAVEVLRSRKFLEIGMEHDMEGDSYEVINISPGGDRWLLSNQHMLTLRRASAASAPEEPPPY